MPLCSPLEQPAQTFRMFRAMFQGENPTYSAETAYMEQKEQKIYLKTM